MTQDYAQLPDEAFKDWFSSVFGEPKNDSQNVVMSCCYHAWMASRQSLRDSENVKKVMLDAVDNWERGQA